MGTFRSTLLAGYHDDLTTYRKEVYRGKTNKSLYEIVRHVGGQSKLPWLTFVLGSGCLAPTSGEAGDGTPAIDPSQVWNALKSFGLDSTSQNEAVFASDFIRALVAEKLPEVKHLSWLSRRLVDHSATVISPGLALASSLVAALASKLFAAVWAMDDVHHVLDRSDKELIRYPTRPDGAVVQPPGAWHERLVSILSRIGTHLDTWDGPDDRTVQAYRELLARVELQLTNPREAFKRDPDRLKPRTPSLWRSQVEALTAFAWYFLTDGTTIYPGWSDMLLFQAANSTENRTEFERVPFLRRPRVETLEPIAENAVLLTRLGRVTERSWADEEGARDVFYQQVARSLLQQASLRSSQSEGEGSDFPLATAFNAAFDVELELALWTEIAAGRTPVNAFAAVIPVYAIDAEESSPFDAEIQWLWCKVVPQSGPHSLDDLLSDPSDDAEAKCRSPWYLVDRSAPLPPELEALPIVVHLAGSPMFGIADVRTRPPRTEESMSRREADEEAEEADRSPFNASTRLHHGLLLDENIATIQFAEDIRDLPGQLHGDFLKSADQDGPTAPRFWVVIGAQLADPAIRFRLVANELRAIGDPEHERLVGHLRSNLGVGEEHRGVVINAWVPASEREVFRWHGYDVVKGRADELNADIEDFVNRIDSLPGGHNHGAA